jgi:hypothetical protein
MSLSDSHHYYYDVEKRIYYFFKSKSGVQIGELKECTIEQLSQLEQLSTNVDANGPVSTLEASTVKDLGYVTGIMLY